MKMESTPLLTTRLYIPTLRTSHVSRPRLLTQLDQGLKGKLSLISATAGFGKTTLLSEWIAALQSSTAWVSLDEGINNPVLFWRYVITALQQADKTIGAAALTALHSGQPPQLELLLTGLINDLSKAVNANHKCPLILVLDDYHTITNNEIHESVFFLLENLPKDVHLVISSRTDPPWPMARLRARQELTELRARDLRFTLEETTAYLNERMDLALLPEDIETLDARTEGWAAGLQMAGLALRGNSGSVQTKPSIQFGHGQTSSYIENFTGTNRFILDYLVEEVLDHQPENIQNFLMNTAVLNRLSSDLCDAVTLQPNSQEILTRLDRDNLFLIPLDDERRWYRYHHLFADLLSQRLMQKNPELVPELHMRASKWYEAQGLIAFAVPHALAANDIPLVTQLAEENVLGMLEQGELGYISEWLKALPDPVVHTQPWLYTAFTWALTHSGRFEEARTCLNELKEIVENESDESNARHIYGQINAIQLYIVAMTFDDWENAMAYARQALKLLPPQDMRTRGLVAVIQGFVQRTNHQYDAARESLFNALRVSKTAGESYAIVDLLCQLARVDFQQGHLQKAAEICREAIRQAELAGQLNNQSLPVVGYAHGTLAGIYLEWNQLEKALQHGQTAESLSQQWGHFDSWIESQQLLALIHQANGCFSESLKVIQNAIQKFDAAAAYLTRYEIYIHLLEGNLEQVTQWYEEEQLKFTPKITGYYLSINLLLARINIARFRLGLITSLEDVINHLNHMEKHLVSFAAERDTIRTSVLKITALQATNQNEKALKSLEQTLFLAKPEEYKHIFLQEGEAMHDMLKEISLHRDWISSQYLKELLSAFEKKNNAGSLPDKKVTLSLVDPLSEREIEVLRLLATPLTTTEIAEALVIAPSTVRSHVKNIYSKLDVHNRIESIQRAETLGIL